MALNWVDFVWTAKKYLTARQVVSLAASELFRQFEVNLGYPGRTSGSFDVSFTAGCPKDSPVRLSQAAAPYTGKGSLPDEAEMDTVSITGYAVTRTLLRCYWRCSDRVGGNYKFDYQVKLSS